MMIRSICQLYSDLSSYDLTHMKKASAYDALFI